MLQHEEEKALKKIEETRKRAKKLLEVKMTNSKKPNAHSVVTSLRLSHD